MVRRPSRRSRLNSIKAHLGQIERLHKHVDHSHRIAPVDEIIEAFGQQRPLTTIRLFDEARQQFSPENHRENHNSAMAFSHSQGQEQKLSWLMTNFDLLFKADSDGPAGLSAKPNLYRDLFSSLEYSLQCHALHKWSIELQFALGK